MEQNATIEKRIYLRPRTKLKLFVVDENGKPQFARISVTDETGHFYAPTAEWTWIQADDGYDRSRSSFEAHYFYANSYPEGISIDVREEPLAIDVTKGFEYGALHRTIDPKTANAADLTFQLKKLDWGRGPGQKWVSSDLHVHMNYGGAYLNERRILLDQAEGEGAADRQQSDCEQRTAISGHRVRAIQRDNRILLPETQEVVLFRAGVPLPVTGGIAEFCDSKITLPAGVRGISKYRSGEFVSDERGCL